MKVKNWNGVEIDFQVAVRYMDNELREELHLGMEPCSYQDFFNAYCAAHEDRFGETWELDKANPVF